MLKISESTESTSRPGKGRVGGGGDNGSGCSGDFDMVFWVTH